MSTPDEPSYYWSLTCPCGEQLRGDSEDEIVETSFAHLREKHPDLADDYSREHILVMAVKLRDLPGGSFFGPDGPFSRP